MKMILDESIILVQFSAINFRWLNFGIGQKLD